MTPSKRAGAIKTFRLAWSAAAEGRHWMRRFLLFPGTFRRVLSWTDSSIFCVTPPCMFLLSIYQPTNTLNEIQCVTSVKIVLASLGGLRMAPRCIFFLVDMLKVPPFSGKHKSFVLSIIIFQRSFESFVHLNQNLIWWFNSVNEFVYQILLLHFTHCRFLPCGPIMTLISASQLSKLTRDE